MKLIVCARGNVRSQTTATVLRDFFGEKDVVVAGLDTFSEEALRSLGKLSDEIWVVGNSPLAHRAENIFSRKVVLMDVGDDRWMKPMHPDLVDVILEKLKGMGYEGSPNYQSVEAYRSAVRR